MGYRKLGTLHLENTYQFKHALDVIFQSFELEYKEDGVKSPRAILHTFHREQALCVKRSIDAYGTTPPYKGAGESLVSVEYVFPVKGTVESELAFIIYMDTVVDIFNPKYRIEVDYPEECQRSWEMCETALHELDGASHA